jgi:hypothetical protein
MIDWRRLYLTYQKITLSQAIDIYVNFPKNEIETLPHSEIIEWNKKREAAEKIIKSAQDAGSFSIFVRNKFVDLSNIIIDRMEFVEWCIKMQSLSEEFMKIIMENDTNLKNIPTNYIVISEDMPATLKVVLELWSEKGNAFLSMSQDEIKKLIREREPDMAKAKLEGCAHVLQGSTAPGVRKRSNTQLA